MRLAKTDRVLLRLPSWLGDFVMAEPTAHALHAFLDPGRLSLVAPPRLFELFGDRFEGARRLAPEESWRGHDVAVLLTGSFRSAWRAWSAGIAERVGWARDGRGVLLTSAARPPLERGGTPLGLGRHGRWPRVLPRPLPTACAELVSSIGVPIRERRPRLEVGEAGRERLDARLAAAGIDAARRLLVIQAGARPGSAKAADARLLVAVVEALVAEHALVPVVVCGPGEEAAARAVARELPGARLDEGGGLGDLVALCARAALVLTPDSGPRHVAAAVGAPVLCLMGPSDPRHTAEHTEATRVCRTVVPCGPCHLEVCPLVGASERRCMRELEPQRVVAAAGELLA